MSTFPKKLTHNPFFTYCQQDEYQEHQKEKEAKQLKVQDFFNGLQNQIDNNRLQNANSLITYIENNINIKLDQNQLNIESDKKNLDLITENFKYEKLEQIINKEQQDASKEKQKNIINNNSEIKLSKKVEQKQLYQPSVQYIDPIKQLQIQQEEQKKMKQIRKQWKELEKNRQNQPKIIEEKTRIELQKKQEIQEQQIEKEKCKRREESIQNLKEIQNRLENRKQESELFFDQIKQIKKQQIEKQIEFYQKLDIDQYEKKTIKNIEDLPQQALLKDDLLFIELEKKKKHLKQQRNLLQNPQLLSEEQMKAYNHHAQYESKYYKKYLVEFKEQKQQHISKKKKSEEMNQKQDKLRELIKSECYPVFSQRLKNELNEKIDLVENKQKVHKKKIKGMEYEYVIPKQVNKEEFDFIAQQYFEHAKLLADRDNPNAKHVRSQQDELTLQQDNNSIQLQKCIQFISYIIFYILQKVKDKRQHDLQYLQKAKQLAKQTDNLYQDYLNDHQLSHQQKRDILLQKSEQQLLQAQKMEKLNKFKNQSNTILDQSYYLGKKAQKDSNFSQIGNSNSVVNLNTNGNKDENNRNYNSNSKMVMNRQSMHDINQEIKNDPHQQVNKIYLDSIKAKIQYLEKIKQQQ